MNVMLDIDPFVIISKAHFNTWNINEKTKNGEQEGNLMERVNDSALI